MSINKIFTQNTHFVPFDKAKGNGRKVFIDTALIPRYIELTHSKAVTPMRLSHAIKALRALAGGFNSSSNQQSAFAHRTSVDGVEVAYTVLQGGQGREGGVYVTDLRLKANHANAGAAGLYNVVLQRNAWSAVKAPASKLSTFYGVISAGAAGPAGEAESEQTANECGKFLAKNTRYDGNYDLFFTPGSRVDSEGTWLTPTQKRLPTSALAQNLANVMRQAEIDFAQKKDPVTWYVLEDGAKVLLQALKLLPATGVTALTKNAFLFANPRESMATLKFALQKVGITLTPDMIKPNSLDSAAVVRQQFTQQHGLAFIKNQKLIDNKVSITQLATNNNLLKKIESFEEAVKKQLLGAAQGWS